MALPYVILCSHPDHELHRGEEGHNDVLGEADQPDVADHICEACARAEQSARSEASRREQASILTRRGRRLEVMRKLADAADISMAELTDLLSEGL